MNIQDVGKLSSGTQLRQYVNKTTKERNPLNVQNLWKVLFPTENSSYTNKFTERNYMSVSHVGKDALGLLSLRQHQKSHREERPYECKERKETLTCCISLKDHLKNHRGKKPFEYKVCRESFLPCGNLKQHQNIHTHRRETL